MAQQDIATLVARLEADVSGFRADLDRANRHLNSFEARARRTSAGAGAAFAGIGASWRGMVAALAVVGIGGGFASLVRTAANFERQMAVIAAQSRATSIDMVALNSTVRALGTEFGIGADAAATAAQELLKSGADIDALNGGALRSTVELARVLGDDYSSAATIAATTMSVFGLAVSDLDEVVQGIAGTVLLGKFELSDYALALQQGGAAANLARLSIEDFNTLLVLFQRRVGGSGSDLGTMARVLLQRLVPASDEAAARMDALGLDFFDARGNFIGLTAAAEELREAFAGMDDESRQRNFNVIFGTDALRGAAALMDEGAAGVERYRTELNEQAEIADVAAARNAGLAGALSQLSAEWKELGIVLLESGIGEFLENLTRGTSEALRGIQDLVRALSGLPAAIDLNVGAGDLNQQIVRIGAELREIREEMSELPEAGGARPFGETLSDRRRAALTRRRAALLEQQQALARQIETQRTAAAAPRGASAEDALRGDRDRRRREVLNERGLADASRAEEDYARALQHSQGAFGAYVAEVAELLRLRGRMPEVADNISALIVQATGDFVRSEAAARGFREEYEQIAREAPAAMRPLAEALAADLNRLSGEPDAAGEAFRDLRREIEDFMATLDAMHERVQVFDDFDALSRELETEAERVGNLHASRLLQLADLETTGLFDAATLDRLRRRMERDYRDALSRADGMDGISIRFADDVTDTLRNAFINGDWSWDSISETLQRGWRGALWDAFIGDDLQNFMRDVALELRRLVNNAFSGSGSGASAGSGRGFFSDILGSIFGGPGRGIVGAGTGDPRNPGDAAGGWIGSILRAATQSFGGFFAEGGFLPPGQWGLAGERGPEPIFGGRSGLSVHPAVEEMAGGARINNVFHIDARGADAGVEQRIRVAVAEASARGAQMGAAAVFKRVRASKTL